MAAAGSAVEGDAEAVGAAAPCVAEAAWVEAGSAEVGAEWLDPRRGLPACRASAGEAAEVTAAEVMGAVAAVDPRSAPDRAAVDLAAAELARELVPAVEGNPLRGQRFLAAAPAAFGRAPAVEEAFPAAAEVCRRLAAGERDPAFRDREF